MAGLEKRWWQRVLPWLAAVTIALVVGGHVGLWLSDAPMAFKRRLTLINAAGWAVVVIPAIAVQFWLRAKLRETDRD